MKNKSLLLSVLLMSVLTSCSSYQNKDEVRKVASKEFECAFTEMMDGKKTQFIFSPASMKLSVTNEKFGNEVVFLEEDNFISGGFSFVMDKKEKDGQWPVKKVEFISYAAKPKVTVNFVRTPASGQERTITKFCE